MAYRVLFPRQAMRSVSQLEACKSAAPNSFHADQSKFLRIMISRMPWCCVSQSPTKRNGGREETSFRSFWYSFCHRSRVHASSRLFQGLFFCFNSKTHAFHQVRLQTQGKTHVLPAIAKVVRDEGVLTFYNGLSASLLRQLTYSTTRFGVYEALAPKVKNVFLYSLLHVARNWQQDYFPGSDLPLYVKIGVSGTAGAIGGFVGTPVLSIMSVSFPTDRLMW